MAIQTDGKIVAAGGNNQIVRLNPDGSPDATFGTAGTGVVATSLAGINALIIQPDGGIVACGFDNSGNGVLTRYTSAGIIDNSFGTSGNGVATAPALSGYDLLAVLQQADGAIVVGGGNGNTFANIVMRFNANGSPDVIFETSPSPIVEGVVGLVVQADGKIVALTGRLKGASGTSPIYLVRYNADGAVDRTFGQNGLVTGPSSIAGANTGLVIQSDGKLLVGGTNNIGTTPTFQVTRFDTQGNLDTSFNGTGFNNIATGFRCYVILLQADGAIVLAGRSQPGFWQLTRYTGTGIVDSSFGNAGTAIGPVALQEAFSIALQANGNIVIGTIGSTAIIARYLSSPAVISTQISSPTASSRISVNTPTTFTGQAQDPSLVFLLIDGVLQPQGAHTDPNNWSITATAKTIGTHTAQAVSLYQDGNVNIASDPITFASGPQAPSSFTGTITKNEFLNKTECVLQATWTPSVNGATTQYIIAQNGVILATIPATQPLQFVYCGSCKGNAFNGITVSAATASGIVGAPQPLVVV
ncbi:MAG: hypothetical protein WCE21_04790 [Candidatus Babeliales bacterium]